MESMLHYHGQLLIAILDRVFVLPEPSEDTSAGGMAIPEAHREQRSGRGRVVAVGPGWKDKTGVRVPMECRVGDRVFFHRTTGLPCVIDGVEHLVMKDGDVEAIERP